MITIQINNHQKIISSEKELIHALQESEIEKYREISIYGYDEKSLTVLTNGNHAFLMYLKSKDDSGYYSINSKEESENYLDFKLPNGQLDEYPEN